ncbi:MAG: OB-fold nucleic acid binding domain-containing protein, partial [Synechocystis sp.]
MSHRRILEILRHGQADETVTVKGWLRTKRALKGFSFVEINDGSSLANLQAVLDGSLPDYENLLSQLNTGTAVTITGQLVASPGQGQKVELKATALSVVGESDPATYPLQKKRHSFEFLRTIGHLRPRTNTIGAVMRVRNACATAIHQFFQSKGFLWVHTPIITASDCEGAGD